MTLGKVAPLSRSIPALKTKAGKHPHINHISNEKREKANKQGRTAYEQTLVMV